LIESGERPLPSNTGESFYQARLPSSSQAPHWAFPFVPKSSRKAWRRKADLLAFRVDQPLNRPTPDSCSELPWVPDVRITTRKQVVVANANSLERKATLECNSMEDADYLCILQYYLHDFGRVPLGCSPECGDKA
jgi:hypothetical protein